MTKIWDGVERRGFRCPEIEAVAAVPDSGCVAAAGGGAVLSEILGGRARLYEAVATDVVDTRDITDVISEVVEIWGT